MTPSLAAAEIAVKIRFETTIDDIVAFNRFHCENSPTWRRQRFVQYLIVPGIIGILSLCVFFSVFEQLARNPAVLVGFAIGTLLLFSIFSISWVIFVRWQAAANVVSMVRKLLAEGSNRTILGWREIALVGNRLLVNSELIQASYDLRAIEKIVGNDEYTFVYYSSIQAFVIPMNLYPEEEYREFVVELRRAWENREAPAPETDAAWQPPDVRIARHDNRN